MSTPETGMKAFALLLASAFACGALSACSRSTPPDAPDPAPPVVQAPAPTTPPPTEASSIPERFQGAWASDETACTTAGHESRLVVAADSLGFHESRGPVKEVTINGDDLTVVTQLTGEGETREATHHFNLADGGNRLTDRDSGMVRRRCDI
jgi:hypothetical protein